MINIDGGIQCLQCGATMKHMRNYKRHLMDKHIISTSCHYCGYCGKVYGTKNSLSTHLYSYHREQYLADKGRIAAPNKANVWPKIKCYGFYMRKHLLGFRGALKNFFSPEKSYFLLPPPPRKREKLGP